MIQALDLLLCINVDLPLLIFDILFLQVDVSSPKSVQL